MLLTLAVPLTDWYDFREDFLKTVFWVFAYLHAMTFTYSQKTTASQLHSFTSTFRTLTQVIWFPRSINSCLLSLSRKHTVVALYYLCPLHLCWFNNFPVNCHYGALLQSHQPLLCVPKALWQIPSWQLFLSLQDGKNKLQLGLKGMGNLPGLRGFDSLLLQCLPTGGLTQLISQAWIYCDPLSQRCDEGGGKGIFNSAMNPCRSSL